MNANTEYQIICFKCYPIITSKVSIYFRDCLRKARKLLTLCVYQDKKKFQQNVTPARYLKRRSAGKNLKRRSWAGGQTHQLAWNWKMKNKPLLVGKKRAYSMSCFDIASYFMHTNTIIYEEMKHNQRYIYSGFRV